MIWRAASSKGYILPYPNITLSNLMTQIHQESSLPFCFHPVTERSIFCWPMAMSNKSLSHAGSAAWPQRHRVEMWCIPHTAHLLQERSHQPTCIQEHKQAGPLSRLNTLFPEVNLNPWGSVQLLCDWKEEGVYEESRSFHRWSVEVLLIACYC